MTDLEDYFREAKVRARVGDWRGLELAALGMVGEARRRQAEGPRVDPENGAAVVPDGGAVVTRRDSPAWSDEELRRLSPDDQRKVTRLTDIAQMHLSEFDGGSWR